MSDPDGTEYAFLAEGGTVRQAPEAFTSLAVHLGVTVAEVIELRDAGLLGEAIAQRSRPLDWTEAAAALRRKFPVRAV